MSPLRLESRVYGFLKEGILLTTKYWLQSIIYYWKLYIHHIYLQVRISITSIFDCFEMAAKHSEKQARRKMGRHYLVLWQYVLSGWTESCQITPSTTPTFWWNVEQNPENNRQSTYKKSCRQEVQGGVFTWKFKSEPPWFHQHPGSRTNFCLAVKV